MAEDICVRIESRGVDQLVEENTRFVANAEPSRLDLIYTSKPDNTDHRVSEWGTSDHRLLEVEKVNSWGLPQPERMR